MSPNNSTAFNMPPANRQVSSIIPKTPGETDGPPVPFWSEVFSDCMEAFVLYGAAVHPNAFPAKLFRTDDTVAQPDQIFQPLRVVVAPPASPAEVAAADLKQIAGDVGGISRNAGLLKSDDVTSVGVVRGTARRLWAWMAGLWIGWRREREIKRAVYALQDFDDRTLRDMGICQRSLIEPTVRQGRDC